MFAGVYYLNLLPCTKGLFGEMEVWTYTGEVSNSYSIFLMLTVKKIKATSLGKVCGALYGLMGLIFGIIFALFMVVGFEGSPYDPMMGFVYGVGAIIFLPFLYGLMGFLAGLIMAFLYNISASWSGGIQIETEE